MKTIITTLADASKLLVAKCRIFLIISWSISVVVTDRHPTSTQPSPHISSSVSTKIFIFSADLRMLMLQLCLI